jgi:predicted TIM-barrel fold metal-dependent hydrolase
VADDHGFPHAIVAHADLADEGVEATLAAHAELDNVRGIRQILGHTDDPELRRTDRPDYPSDPAWQRGYGLLAKFAMSFDLQVFPAQMSAVAAVAGGHPDVPFIVCHTGFPWDRSPQGLEAWRRGMKALAALPHGYAKLSGPGMVMVDWTTEGFAPFIHETIDMFGPARCMFASNVPPDALHKSYDQIYQAFYTQQRRLFHDTAVEAYRI